MCGIKPTKEELKILELALLTCADFQEPNGGCEKGCDFKDICDDLLRKIWQHIKNYPHLRNEKWQFREVG